MNPLILIAEDDADIRGLLKLYLEGEGFRVLEADNGARALDLARAQAPDMAILDIMMPQLNGFELTRALRKFSDIPILILSAKSQDNDKILGLNLGADDYITKPFTLSVLYAKTMALIRRSRGTVRSGDRLEVGGIALELSAQKVYVNRREVALTPKEFALLRCLMQNKNMVMSREQLLVKCWGYDYEGESRAVDTHIRRLRDKLGEEAGRIKTVIKAGYRLEG